MAWDRSTEQAMPSHEVTHLHLLRHGAVDTGGQRRCYGHTDYPPSGEGLVQAAALVEHVQANLPRPDGILSSDLLRCRALAEGLSAALGLPVELVPGLREQHMGGWEGRTWAALTSEDVVGVRQYWSDYAHTQPPHGESFAAMGVRVEQALSEQWERLRGRRWLVVTHAGPIRALCAQRLGLPVSEALRFSPLPGSHTWLQVAQAGTVLQVMGERPAGQTAGQAGAARRVVRPASSRPRIALSGSAGTGKTTLGRALAARWKVPYVPEGMRERIERGLDLHTLGHDALRALLWELWEEQQHREDVALREVGGFVSDRSPVDYLAFWLLYGFFTDDAETRRLEGAVEARLGTLDRVVVLPHGILPLQADGVRSSNPWIQLRYQSLVEGLLHRRVAAEQLALLPALTALDERVSWVEDLVSRGGLGSA